MNEKKQPNRELNLFESHSRRFTDNGTCHDCAQGLFSGTKAGFAFWSQDGDDRGFWFCRYCGSNHVTVVLETGEVFEQGDLYDGDGTATF